MKPNTKLTVAQFRRFFTPWRYAPKRMIWDGRYISIQPVTPKKTTSTTRRRSGPLAASTPTGRSGPHRLRRQGHARRIG